MFHFCILKSDANATLNLFASEKGCGGQRSSVRFTYEFFGALASDVGQKRRGDIGGTFAQVKCIFCCHKYRKVRCVTHPESTLRIGSHKMHFFWQLFTLRSIISHYSSVYFLILPATLLFYTFNESLLSLPCFCKGLTCKNEYNLFCSHWFFLH